MDAHGVDMTILSLNAPAVQAIADSKRAIAVAKEANNALAEHVSKRRNLFPPPYSPPSHRRFFCSRSCHA